MTIADNSERTGRPKNRASISGADSHEYIRRKQRTNDFDALTVLPHAHGLIGGKKRLNLPGIQVTHHRPLGLRHGVEGKPFWIYLRVGKDR